MPSAFSNAGYIPGLIGTILSGILCAHCLRILVNLNQHFKSKFESNHLYYFQVSAQYELCKQNRVSFLSYRETMKLALEIGPHSLRCFSKYA